jgi:hypothetical protein
MEDAFTRQPTCIRGPLLPNEERRRRLQDDHRRRLEALARLGEAAAQCDLRADTDRDLVVLEEDEVSLLEGTGPQWARFGEAIRSLRALLPLVRLPEFGFPGREGEGVDETNERMFRVGGGVEAWAFALPADGSVYKFYWPQEERTIGSEFEFSPGEETVLQAKAEFGSYRALLEKLLLIQLLGGMATEVLAVTPEGVLVAKQAYGEPMPQGDDMSGKLPSGLIEIPSRFLRANRDHPRLTFAMGRPYLVADLHARNFVRAADGALRLIDLVAGPWPDDEPLRDPLISEWLGRVRADPLAPALPRAPDDEL